MKILAIQSTLSVDVVSQVTFCEPTGPSLGTLRETQGAKGTLTCVGAWEPVSRFGRAAHATSVNFEVESPVPLASQKESWRLETSRHFKQMLHYLGNI